MSFLRFGLRAAVCVALATSGISASAQFFSVPKELPNLGKLRLEVEAYHDCRGPYGCYTRDLNRETALATADLERVVQTNRNRAKLAVVLDIDETSLTNYAEMLRDDFAYSPQAWDRWALQADAPAIPGTLRFYREARRLGVAVFFITGRPESEREATGENLRRDGYTQWAGLTLRSAAEAKMPAIAYKSAARQKIVNAGYRIAVNIGDQLSDLEGKPEAEYSVKLSDPFYYIP